ncbi:MAG TPA: acetylornithine transaminase [Candidatus Methylomirabilis sp.]|nr:acetylornithine transaminase [Candidatus Methylomirabilis sp.]
MTFEDFPVSSLMDITSRPDLVFVSGQGSWLFDHAGRRYLDFVQGWAVNCLGHSPRVIVDALTTQASRLISPSPAFYNQPMLELASLVGRTSGLDRVFFCNSGAEANEGAIKLARRWGQKARGGAYEIITFEGSFHGRTLATMSASGKPGWDTLFAPQVQGFPKAKLNDVESVERLIGKDTVAVMLEPVQGEGGVNPATPAFMRALRALTRERRLLLIADEIQTGIGRLGTLYGCQSFPDVDGPVRPDIMTLGKGLGGGVPIAALVARAEVSVFNHGDQGGTFNGNPLMCAVGLAVLAEVARPAFLAHVQAVGSYLSERLTGLAAELGLGPERGMGLLRALELGTDLAADVVAAAREGGFLLNAPRPSVLRFMPALTVTTNEIDLMIEGLRAAIVHVRRHGAARAA